MARNYTALPPVPCGQLASHQRQPVIPPTGLEGQTFLFSSVPAPTADHVFSDT
jgi:hypothetical protein